MAKARIPIDRAISEGWFTPNQNNGYCECGCGDLAPIAKKTGRDQGILIGESQHFIMGHANKLHAVARMITQEQAAAEGWHKPNTNDGYCHCGCGKKTQIAPKISRLTGTLQGEHYQFCKGHKRVPEPPPGIAWNESGLCLCGCGQKTAIAHKSDYQNGIVNGRPRWYVENHRPKKEDKRELSGYLQTCEECGQSKPLRRFRKDKGLPTGRIPICKDCLPQTETVTQSDQLLRMVITRMRNKKFAYQYTCTHPCIECGESDPIVLHFHHRDPATKENIVARLIHNSSSLARIMAEIDKCDVLCANCHIKHHAPDQEWTKSTQDFYVDIPPEFHYLWNTLTDDRRDVMRLI